jgi:spermidine/putrescine transport system substrate-binding protein
MLRRSWSVIAALLACAATAGAATAGAQAAWSCPPGFAGQTLSVYNWTTYIADTTIADFEAACGVRVIYDTYPSDDDMLARMRQGNPGYDIAVPSDRIVAIMIEEDLLLPLERGRLPNWVHLDPTFLDLDFDPGNRFSVPYQWGTLGIGYHVGRVGFVIESWMDMFTYDGPVSWIEDIRAMMGSAAVAMGLDPNTDDPSEIGAIQAFMIEHGRNVVYINQDDGQEILLRGEVDIVVEYSGDIFQIIDECACDDFAFVIPREGANFWVDNLVIPAGASNVPLAHVFLDYMLSPRVAADIANATAYGSPNQSAVDLGLIDAELLSDPGIYPDEETEARLFRTVQDSSLEQLYNDAWDELKIFIGR